MRNQAFEFRVYPADEHGAMNTTDEFTLVADFRDIGGARARAGSLAKKHNGPVDLAYAGEEGWPERYITTAAPSSFHKTGFRFERITG